MRILVVLFAGFRAPFFCIPALRGSGAVVAISQKKSARGANLDYARHRHPPVHRTVGVSPGEGPGRELPPRRKEPYRPSPGLPRRSGGYRGDGPGRETLYTFFPFSPPRPRFALLPRPPAGAVQVISLEKPAWGAGPDYVRHWRHPTHRTVGVSPGEGPGREPPPRRKEPYRPSPGFPRRSGGYRGDGPGRA